MGKVRVVLNSRGVQALLKARGVQADMHRRAGQIAARAGAGMEASSMVGTGRARASVITATHAAREAESSGRALTSAIDAGRR
jgi:hypothetical protein